MIYETDFVTLTLTLTEQIASFSSFESAPGHGVLLSFAKVMEHYPFYYIPLTLPSPPTTGEKIKVRGLM